jgi:hypothetical protein
MIETPQFLTWPSVIKLLREIDDEAAVVRASRAA